MTFNFTLTAQIPPLMPPTDSSLASTPYTNGLLTTPLNLTPPKPKLFFSTYPYVLPPSLNHPHPSKHDYPPQLHWLPIYRIKYKLSLTIHKAIYINSPDYLASLLYLHIPDPPTPLSLLHPTYTTYTPPIYAHLPYLHLTIGTPYPTTFEQ